MLTGQTAPVAADPNNVANPTPAAYVPITGPQRLEWMAVDTIGPRNLAAGLAVAGVDTWLNSPKEYGPHWDGFAMRYGLRLTGIAVSDVMEAGVGAIWGEDPRYIRSDGTGSFGSRFKRIIKWTFYAPNRDGKVIPAYARLIAYPASSFLCNLWYPDSQSNTKYSLERTGLDFSSKLLGNAFTEFFPDIFHHRSKKKAAPAQP